MRYPEQSVMDTPPEMAYNNNSDSSPTAILNQNEEVSSI
jgi:hypothetical protein